MFRNRKRYGRGRISSFLLTFIVVLAIGMGIGYAAIATTLTIDGTSDVDSARWDVHFDNINVTTGSVTANTPTITDDTSISFSATLENPGDFYEFTVDVVNAGTLDAKLDAIEVLPVLTQEQSNFFSYTVTYVDGASIEVNDGLDAGTTQTLLIRFGYLTQSDTSLYPTDDQNFSFSVAMTYIQGHGNIRVYDITTADIGQPIPDGVTTYNTPAEAMAAFSNRPFYLKHIVVNGIVTESYVEFVVTESMATANPGMAAGKYTLMRGPNEQSLTEQPLYETNKASLLSAFGSANCIDYISQFNCSVSGLNAVVATSGGVIAGDEYWYCFVNSGGESGCTNE